MRLQSVGSDPQFPDVTPRDAQALREWKAVQARRMTEQGRRMSAGASYLYGPLTRIGVVTTLVTVLLDQASKLWLLWVCDLAANGPIRLGPFLSLVLTWNTGISYGWLPQDGPYGQWAVLGFKLVAVALLWIWLARTETKISAVALGLIIGGAIGNAIDRLAYGAVADFVLLHVITARWSFHWYVFNLADVAIVAGVIGLLYESVWGTPAAKAP